MKKNLKRFFAGLIAAATVFGFAACGGGNNSGSSSGGGTFDDGDNKTTVRYYSFNNDTVNKELNDAIKNDFNKIYPDIKIQTQISTGSFYTNLLTDFSGNTEADVFNMEPGEIYPFLSANYLEPLDDYFGKSEKISLDDVWSINKDAYAFDYSSKKFGRGKTYAVLKDWTTDSMLLYNRKLFTPEQLAVIEQDSDGDGIPDPLSFGEFETLCKDLVKKSGNVITQYSFLPGLAEAKVLEQFITNAGECWFKNDYSSNFDSKAVQDVVKYYYGILGMNEVNNTGSTFYPIFAQGKCAMIMGGLYCIDSYNLDDMDLGIAYPPVKEKGMQSKPYTTGCVGFAMSSRSKVKDAAFKFIEWYLEYFGKKQAEKCDNFPAIERFTQEIMLNPEVNKNVTRLAHANKFYKSLSSAVIIDRNLYCSQASVESIEFKFAGSYLQGEMSIADFCGNLDYEINKRVDRAKKAE